MFRHFPSIVLLFAALAWAHDSSAEGKAAPQAGVSTQDAPTADGSLVICGGGSLPERVLARLVELAGGGEGRLVVIPTAGSDEGAMEQTEIIRRWIELGLGSVSVLHTRDRKEADSATFVEPLSKATAVWFRGGQQSRLADSYVTIVTAKGGSASLSVHTFRSGQSFRLHELERSTND